jgi:hypothetical protein
MIRSEKLDVYGSRIDDFDIAIDDTGFKSYAEEMVCDGRVKFCVIPELFDRRMQPRDMVVN